MLWLKIVINQISNFFSIGLDVLSIVDFLCFEEMKGRVNLFEIEK